MRAARSSRQVESRPPESSTTTGRPSASSPSSRTRANISSAPAAISVSLARDEHLGRLGESLQAHLGDSVELKVTSRALDHGASHQYLAAGGPGRDPRGDVHVATVV